MISAQTNGMPAEPKRLAKVVSIQRFAPRPAQVPEPAEVPSAVTQERLRKGAELLAEEWRIVREMREFTLALESDLAAGAEIESGDLVFDRELKMIRFKRQVHPAVVTPIPAAAR